MKAQAPMRDFKVKLICALNRSTNDNIGIKAQMLHDIHNDKYETTQALFDAMWDLVNLKVTTELTRSTAILHNFGFTVSF